MGLEGWGPSGASPYPDAMFLSSGRSCLALILEIEKPRRVHVPFHSCDTLLHPMLERGIELVYYSLDDQLLPIGEITPAEDELTIVIDYFGVRTAQARRLAVKLGPRAVLDSTHAYFAGAPPAGHYGFNSARKFRGVPDGAYLFAPRVISIDPESNSDVHGDHLILRMLGAGPSARASYLVNEQSISTTIQRASRLSSELITRLDHTSAQRRRLENFMVAHEILGSMNSLQFDLPELTSPLNYPLMLDSSVNLEKVHGSGIFAARYWPEIPMRPGAERFPEALSFTARLLAFPIDQRYTADQIRERAWQLKNLV